MAEGKSREILMPKPVGQPKLPRITGTPDHFTGMLDHIKWNPGPHGMESKLAPLRGTRNEMMLPYIYYPFLDSCGPPR
jgi:hypothetical protein